MTELQSMGALNLIKTGRIIGQVHNKTCTSEINMNFNCAQEEPQAIPEATGLGWKNQGLKSYSQQ